MQASTIAASVLPAPLPEGGAGGGFMNHQSPNHHQDPIPPLRASVPSCLNPFPFHPTAEAASDILEALADPNQTLREIARRFHTTLDALAEWIDTPPVLQRIEKLKRLIATREELILAVNKRLALDTLVALLEAHKHDEEHIPVDPQNLKSVTQRDRRRATARLAASQLIRLANKNPLPEGGGRGWVDPTSGASQSGITDSDSSSPPHIITSSPQPAPTSATNLPPPETSPCPLCTPCFNLIEAPMTG